MKKAVKKYFDKSHVIINTYFTHKAKSLSKISYNFILYL